MSLSNLWSHIRRPANPSNNIQEGFVVEVAKYLNEKGIPCILISETAIALHGRASGIHSVDFVIRDDDEFRMAEVLHMNPKEVIDKEYRRLGNSSARSLPKPAFHIILLTAGLAAASIWKQSQVWWRMPPIPRQFVNPREAALDPEDYILADDETAIRPTLSTDPFAKGHHAVILPTAARLFEATMSLQARHAWTVLACDSRGACETNDLWWLFSEGLQDINKVRSPFKEYYETLEADRDLSAPRRTMIRDLRRYLGEPVTLEDEQAAGKDAAWQEERRKLPPHGVRGW